MFAGHLLHCNVDVIQHTDNLIENAVSICEKHWYLLNSSDKQEQRKNDNPNKPESLWRRLKFDLSTVILRISVMAFVTQIFPLHSQWLTPGKCVRVNACSDNGGNVSLKDVITELCETGHNKCIIAGPDRADKTSMVFQAAVTTATSGLKVVYICTHPISKLPIPVHGMKTPDPSIMRNVDFLYFENCRELISWLANVHEKKKLPSFIVLEDVLTYASQLNENNVEMGLAKLCALVSSSCTWISDHNETGSCSVLMTAPSRIASLEFVCTQFDYKMAQYKGPSNDDSCSHLLFTWDHGHIDVSFHKINDCLMVQDVSATQLT